MENLIMKFKTNNFGIAKSSMMVLRKKEKYLEKKIKKHNGFSEYVSYLVRQYGSYIENNYPFEFRITKKYQDRGEEYNCVKFEVDGNTWMSYQILAFYLRVSISYLFRACPEIICSPYEKELKNKLCYKKQNNFSL